MVLYSGAIRELACILLAALSHGVDPLRMAVGAVAVDRKRVLLVGRKVDYYSEGR